MEFLAKMKKREFIEMGLKTAIGILVGIIVIFFMEAMIYSIYMNSIKENKTLSGSADKAVYYVVENGDSTYDIYKTHTDTKGWKLYFDNLTQDGLDEKMIDTVGELYLTDANLVKIVAKNKAEYLYATNSSPIAQVKAEFKNNHEGETFTVYTRVNESAQWVQHSENLSYLETVKLFSEKGEFKKYDSIKIIYRVPNCFDIYMNATHYIVMVLFLLVIGGIFAWRFTLIAKEYKKLEKRFKKTGKVF